MLLLTVREWLGPSRNAADPLSPVRERLVGMVTRRSFASAVRALREYEEAYKERYSQLAVEFSVVGVSEMSVSVADSMTEGAIALARIEDIDDLLKRFDAITRSEDSNEK